MLVVRALKTVLSERPFHGEIMVLFEGEIVEAERNPHGAVSAIFLGGDPQLGLKPDEYEVIRDDEENMLAELLEAAEDMRNYTREWDWKYGEYWDGVLSKAREVIQATRPAGDPVFLCVGNEPVAITYRGRVYRFEWTESSGWIAVNKDGSERLSAVPAGAWKAIEAAQAARKEPRCESS